MSFFGDGNLHIWIDGSNFKYADLITSGSIPLSNFNTSPVIPPSIYTNYLMASNAVVANNYVQTAQIKPIGTGDITIFTGNKIIASNATVQMEIFPNPPQPVNLACLAVVASNTIGTSNLTTQVLTTGTINGNVYSPITGLGASNSTMNITTVAGTLGNLNITPPVRTVLGLGDNVVNGRNGSMSSFTVSSINGLIYPPPITGVSGSFTNIAVSGTMNATTATVGTLTASGAMSAASGTFGSLTASGAITSASETTGNLTVSGSATIAGVAPLVLLASYLDTGGSINMTGGLNSVPITLPAGWTNYDMLTVQINACYGGADTNNSTQASFYVGDASRQNTPAYPPTPTIPQVNYSMSYVNISAGGSPTSPYFPTISGWATWTFNLFKSQDYSASSSSLQLWINCTGGRLWLCRGGYAPYGWATGAPLGVIVYGGKKV